MQEGWAERPRWPGTGFLGTQEHMPRAILPPFFWFTASRRNWAVFDIARKSAKLKPAYAREQRRTKCTSWDPNHQLFTSRFSSMSLYSARRGALEEVLLSPSLFDEPVLSPYL